MVLLLVRMKISFLKRSPDHLFISVEVLRSGRVAGLVNNLNDPQSSPSGIRRGVGGSTQGTSD